MWGQVAQLLPQRKEQGGSLEWAVVELEGSLAVITMNRYQHNKK